MIQGKPVSKPRWFYVREPTELELSQDVAAAKAEQAGAVAQENGCNQSPAEVIDLKQAAERNRTAL